MLLRKRLNKRYRTTALLQCAACFADEEPACFCHANAPGLTLEQFGSERFFDLLDSSGKGRLCDVAAVGGTREVTLLGNHHDKPHLPQLDLGLHTDNVRQKRESDLFLFEPIYSK
jgi:hypothetical protein